MEYETQFGLRKHKTYDEVVQFIKEDPVKIRFPNRSALFLEAHPVYGQLKDALRGYNDGTLQHAQYMQGDNMAPFEPPRPGMPPQGDGVDGDGGRGGGGGGGYPGGGGPGYPPQDDEMMAPPPAPRPDLIEPGVDPMAQALGNNGMQPPLPPPAAPPYQTIASQIGGLASNFAQNAAAAAGGAFGGAGANAVIQGMGAAGIAEGLIGGLAAGPLGAAAAVGVAGMAAGMIADVPMMNVHQTPMRNRDQPMRQAQHQDIQARHNAGQGPAAFVDTRTINGQNYLKPKDKRLRITGKQSDASWQGYTGQIGGGSSSASGNAQGFAIPTPSAPPPEPDVPPMAAPSFNDMMAQIKKAPMIGTGAGPRERSPRRAENPKRAVGWTRLDPETPGRANAIAIRSKVISSRTRRKADTRDPNPAPTKRTPAPRGGTKRKAEDDINPLVRRPPPKPEGRLKAKKPPIKKPPPDVVIKNPPRPPPPPPPGAAGMTSKNTKKGKAVK
jgi:hypothetical protein